MRISDWSSDVCSSDLRKLTELSTTLGVGLLQAGMLLVTFIGILWALSDNIVFNFNGSSFAIPGYMVWCAILYALIGSLLTWRVGLPLIALNTESYAREAAIGRASCRERVCQYV